MADRRTLTAVVLGCGPAGLLAAHGIANGARQKGMDSQVRIYSAKRKSPLFGCQYLHRSIPGLDLRCQRVKYELTGRKDVYRRKVYGENEDVLVSVETLMRDHFAWDIRQAYDQLWRTYEPAIEDYYLSPGSWRILRARLEGEGVDLVVSTIPAPVLCEEKPTCKFESEQIWAQGDAPELGRWALTPVELTDGRVVCSGMERDPWYRVSRVFGHHTVEWPENVAAPRGASKVTKPIKTTCKCHPTLHRSGRYATWKKGVLAHASYEDGFRLAARACLR